MTREQFLGLFEKHLRVGGLKRNEIMAETRHHLEELEGDQDPKVVLGAPKSLAHQLNRVHVGWGSNPWTPILLLGMWAPVMSLLGSLSRAWGVSIETLADSRIHTAIWALNNFFFLIGPVGGAIFVGLRMSRLHAPWRYLCMILGAISLVTFLTSVRSMLREPGFDQLWVLWLAGLEIALAFGLAFTLGALLSMVVALPRQTVSPKRRRFGVWFEILLATGLLVIGYFALMMISESLFQPYDTWSTEMRPRGSWVLVVNDFFETGWGTPLLMMGYTAFIGRRAWKNIVRLRQPA
jgi:hypothetical protein